MSKGSKSTNTSANGKNLKKEKDNEKTHSIDEGTANSDFLLRMSLSPRIGADANWFQMIPAVFFTAVVIMITRMASYERPMDQFFFWSGSSNTLTDFFSYYKMVAIIICAVLVLVILLYRVFSQSLYIKRSFAYAPMIAYIIFVLLSYATSDYKVFALWGWNDRFEGTMTLMAYMVLLFYIINTINSEKNVKWIIYSLAGVSTILGLLGITQALNHDFFRTDLGKKFITPSWFWDQLDSLNFTFTNQIYQTVYNINYVSFYLTLLIPIFGILFIRSVMLGKEETLTKKIIWGALFTLLIFNLIGSASSGGLMGMAFVVLMALFVLNKRILQWWKPIAILVVLTLIIGGVTLDRWSPELSYAIQSVAGPQTESEEQPVSEHKIDSLVTSGDAIYLTYEGAQLTFKTYFDDPSSITVTDSESKPLTVAAVEGENYVYQLQDERYNWISVKPAKDEELNHYIVLITDGYEWPFMLTQEGPKYRTSSGSLLNLYDVPAVGWENNQEFGSGRGYIWSRTIPMLQETILLGHGADTYCIYFPHEDYVGKYNSGTFSSNIGIIVDKPHNMYFGAIVGTGGVSMMMLLLLWGFYLVQSFRIYFKEKYDSFIAYVGVGIFLGICGFLVSGLVNDSTVSVMPMFYGLLGTGISINMMLKGKR